MKYTYCTFFMVLIITLFGCKGGSVATSVPPPASPGELKVISITPLNGASNTARDGVITVTFSQDLSTSTVNTSTLTVTDEQHYSVEADFIIVDGNKATFKSKNKLFSDRKYIVTVTSDIKGINGEVMSGAYISDFITQNSEWSSPESISSANYARTAMDNHGHAITVWWRYNNGRYEIVMSQLNGGNWSNPQVISGNATQVYSPSVSMDNNGNAIIVWADWGDLVNTCGIVMTEYRNGVWSSPRFLNTKPFITVDPPSVAMNDNGKALIVWSQDDIYKLEYINGSWSTPTAVSTGGDAEDPHVAINDKGNSIITWLYNDGYATHKKIFSSEFQNEIWSDPKIVSIPGYDPVFYRIAYDDNNNAIVVWVQEYHQVFRNEYRNGNWLGPVSVTSFGADVLYATVTMDGHGNAVMVWQQTVDLIYQVFISELRDGAWSAPTQVSTLGTAASNPLIKMDKSGNAILLWNQADNNGRQVFRMQYLNGGWTDKYLMAMSQNQLNNVGYDVAMDGSGDAIIVWDQSDGSTWKIYRSFYQ
jgi:hypothetical protein